ncbi:FAD-dependent oxidoreductase [Actinomadura graeca]|uniref:FAD-dependent oxidoreductase n=1 Tax=Actinomadura graeca TaxID=2750812 RepID=A0ABX8R428_9ACTN|nr:FAD-dependent oxidoreductase [Actinomadura graeca]QXJ23768.1 FAD-dependent oxidoreductase [Actinomadura graeca]
MRIAIAGAGIAGLGTAWLLDPVHDVVVFESQPRVGGRVLTVTTSAGQAVDVGAQHVAPGAFPLYGRLLEELGLAPEAVVEVPLSVTVLRGAGSAPALVSPHGGEAGRGRSTILGDGWAAVRLMVDRATEWRARDTSWEVPLSDLVEPLPVARDVKDTLLYPLPAAIFGCDTTRVREMSARAATDLLAAVPPASPDEAPVWHGLRAGLGGVPGALADGLVRGRVRTGAGVRLLRRSGDEIEVTDSTGSLHLVDRVVLATHPDEAARLIAPLPGTGGLVGALNEFGYTEVLVAAHTDPAYMPAERRHWSTSTVTVHGGWAESSTWCGTDGADVFKSWITHREEAPRKPLALASFRQLCLTPPAVRARTRVAAAQGRGGIHFAGHYLHRVDSQESALASAVDVARRLAPDGPRLRRLLGRRPAAG